MKKKSYKGRMVATAIFLVLFLLLGAFVGYYMFGAHYELDKTATKEAKIPLSDGFCPQGLCPLPDGSNFDYAVSGYRKDAPSRIYLVGETEKYVTVKDGDKELSTHFGGVTCTGEYLLVASGKTLVRVTLSDVLAAEDGASVPVKDKLTLPCSAAYCYSYDNTLYAGEFYRKGNYETEESHHLEKDGETNYALVYAFDIDESKEGGVVSSTPKAVLSVRGLVQGIAVYEDGIALSTSYGLPDSHIYFYKNVLKEETTATFDVNGTQVPLYRLDSSVLTKTVVAPCMSEEIFEENGKLFILFESKCDKYKQFVRRQTDSILSVAI